MAQITEQMKKLIEENAMALATIGKDGVPHCVAVGYAKVVSENQIVITNIYMSETIKNIEDNKKVALAVWNKEWEDESRCEGYELKGGAKHFVSGQWKKFVDNLSENQEDNSKGALLVSVDKIKKLA